MVSVCLPFRFRLFPALALAALSANAVAAIPQTERDALIALYNSTGGAQWEHNIGWNGVPGTECEWDDVVCDSTGATVIELHLSYNNMTGTVTPLSALTNLQFFDVNDNTLSGPLPALSSLKKLQYFDVLNNGFSGAIPALTGLTSLQYFNVDSNHLSGPFPSLAGLTNLQVFDIADNHQTDGSTGDANGITGSLPSLSALTQLQVFKVSGNKLSGALPDLTPLKQLQDFEAVGTWTGDGNHFTGPVPAIAGLTALQYFDVHNNQLTGPVPSLANSPNLIGFSVGQNQLSGTIPSLANLPQMQYLGLYDAGLSGQIPSLSGLTHLVQISVGYNNNLTGPIPSLAGLTELQLFEASYNQLSGPLPALTGLTQLQVFNAALNDLSGPIPSLDGLTALLEFDVAYNHLSGPIPALTGSPQLYQFSANYNELTGSLPALAGLTNLQALEFSDNQLTGSIPALDGSPLLRYFSVARNSLSGSVPSLAGLSQLVNFDISFNQLSGSIPALSGLTNLQYAYFDFNTLSGPIPALTGLSELREFIVLDNQLGGSIPALSGLGNLQAFNAERNQLSGALPALSGLTNLSYFSVSGNQLSGQLPQLSGLDSLNTFDVSFNAISGSIPALSQLPNLQYLYLDVNRLTGPIPNLSNLAGLFVFDAGNNQLTGTIPPLGALSNLQQFNVYSNALTGSLPALAGLSNLQYFQVGGNFLSGAIPAVPNPNNLVAGLSSLCPNALVLTPDPNWDLAVGNEPWYATCATPESAKQAPTAQDSSHIVLSGNGSIKLFQSQEATLVPGNKNTTGQDIYSVGADGLPVLEDIDESGQQMIGIASLPAVSNDGKVVAFQFAPLAGFFAGTPNAIAIYAGQQGAPKHRVDVGMGGTNASGSADGAPSLAGVNGNYRLAFCSSASNLVGGDSNLFRDVFVADPLTPASPIARVSLDSNGNEIAGDSCEPKLSADATKVVFSISAPTLFTTPARQIVLKDLGSSSAIHAAITSTAGAAGQLSLMSAMAATNQPANADSAEPAINADGSVVAFTSQASNLDGLGPPTGGKEVYVALGNGTLMTRARSGDGTVPNGASQQPQLSADGTTMVVHSDATNWQGGTIGQCGAVALNTNFFALAPVGGTLCASSETTVNQNPAISADGIVTGFDSNAAQVNGNTNANTYAQGMGSFAGVSGMAVPNLNGDFSGQWFNPDQSGHGLVIDVTKPDANNKRLLVLTWFVYLNGKPTWVQGVGVPHAGSGSAANTVIAQLDQVGIFKGESFPLGAEHASASLWGGITLSFTDANTGTLTWKSSYPGFGSGSMPIKHFLAVGLPGQDAPATQVKSCYSGNWFNPAQSGHGFELEVLNAPGSTSNFLAVDWFAYGPDGSPVWLSGSAPITGNGAQMHLTLIDGAGAQFPPNFNPAGITGHDWGTATFTFTDSAHAQVTWSSTIDGYGSGTQPLQPLGVGLLDRRGCTGALPPPPSSVAFPAGE